MIEDATHPRAPARLPWPIARLVARSADAPSARAARDFAWLAFEASVRLAVIASLPNGVAAPKDRSIAAWAAALDPPEVEIDTADLDASLPPGTPALLDALELVARIVSLGLGWKPEAAGDAGGLRDEAAALRVALERLWAADAFWASPWRLVALVASPSGAPRAADLGADELRWLADRPAELAGASADSVWLAAGAAWRELHPHVAVVPDRDASQVGLTMLVYAGETAAGPEYLDLRDGDRLSGARLARRRIELGSGSWSAGDDVGAVGVPLDFDALGVLGQGGMGRVVLARQRRTGRLVALKFLRSWVAGFEGELRRRFEREIDVLARCDHPGIARIVDSGESAGEPWYAMEFVDGPTLSAVARHVGPRRGLAVAVADAQAERVQRAPSLPESTDAAAPAPGREVPPWTAIAHLVAGLADALEHLHTRGVLHRDVSPSNVVVEWPGLRPVLTDFGLATVAESKLRLTAPGAEPLGTLLYSAPERLLRGDAGDTPRADLYSLAAVAFELVTGEPVHPARSADELRASLARSTPRWAHRVRPDVPPELSAVLRVALDRDPDARYPSVAAFAADLRRFAAGRPVTAALDGPWRTLAAAARRHRRWLVAAGAVAAIASAALAIGHWQGSTTARADVSAMVEEALQPGRGWLWDDVAPQREDDVRALLEALRSRHGSTRLPDVESGRAELGRVTRGDAATADSARPDEAVVALRARLASDEPLTLDAARALLAESTDWPTRRRTALVTELDRLAETVALAAPERDRRGSLAEAGNAWRSLAAEVDGTWLPIQLYERAAWAAEGAGDVAQARADLEQAVAIAEALSPAAVDSGRPSLALARLERDSGDPGAARDRLTTLAEARRARLGPEHPATLEVEAELAHLALVDGQVDGVVLAAIDDLVLRASALEGHQGPWRLDLFLAVAAAHLARGESAAGSLAVEAALVLPEASTWLDAQVLAGWQRATRDRTGTTEWDGSARNP